MAGADKVKKNMRDWAKRQKAASLALAQHWAAKMEKHMKDKASWQDRTGNARAGLFARPDIEGNDIIIRVAHSVEYGVYLELARDGKYAILKPTVERFAEDVAESYRKLWE
jgi:hypothetical protein